MDSWILVMLGMALAGGLLVLNGFSNYKEANENILDVYRGMLDNAKPAPKAGKAPDNASDI